jgi:hypothetical protein
MKLRSTFAGSFCFSVLGIAAVLLALSSLSMAQNKVSQAADVGTSLSYRAGGKSIVIPSPTKDLVEVGDDYRVLFDNIVPVQNRLLAAFLSPGEAALIESGKGKRLSRYSLVEVPRQREFADFTPENLKEVVDSTNQKLGSNLDSSLKESEEQFNRRMKDLKLDKATVTLDEPIPLGCLFSKKDTYAMGMIMPFTREGKTTKMVAGIVFLRVQNRLLFAYLYSVYEDEDSVRWVRATSEDWADAILKANP